MARTIALADGATLLFEESFLNPEEAGAFFRQLRDRTTWRQEVGRGRPFPRLTAWYADDGLVYRYSSLTHEGMGWLPSAGDCLGGTRYDCPRDLSQVIQRIFSRSRVTAPGSWVTTNTRSPSSPSTASP